MTLYHEQKQVLSSTMNCLIATMSEMQVLETEVHQNDVDMQLKWLALTLLIALQDDEFCNFTLTKRGLLNHIELALTTTTDTTINVAIPNEDDENSYSENNNLNRIYQLISLSENCGMNETTKVLLKLCATYSQSKIIIGNDNYYSMGLIQRKIIHLSSHVEEVVNVFTSIDHQVKKSMQQSSSSSPYNSDSQYSQNDIDYFIIEAHNRAISLLYIGDYHNAEKLLTVALNLSPFCGKEVQCHGGEIRKVYRGVIQRRSCEDNDFLGVYNDDFVGVGAVSGLY